MTTSPNLRDLSVESGIIIDAPGVFYPTNLNEPQRTDKLYAAFMQIVLADLAKSGWVVNSRERYHPGPYGTGGAFSHVGELLHFANTISPIIVASTIALFPDELKCLGAKIKAGLSARAFRASWDRAHASEQLPAATYRAPILLQENLEGLCLLNVIATGSGHETDIRVHASIPTPNYPGSASHPSGGETYAISISSSERRYDFHVDGRGFGTKIILGGQANESVSVIVDLSGDAPTEKTP